MNLRKRFLIEPETRVRLSDHDPDDTAGLEDKDDVREILAHNIARLEKLQYLMYAESRRALLVVLQAMDAGGKDGTIRHVMEGLNPQGCSVTSFKTPSAEELKHDFLWRIHKAIPGRGDLGIFNRSHYEDVLIARVHGLVPKAVWKKRYEQINAFEKILADNGVAMVKFMLHISKKEQRRRFQERIDDPHRRWKISPADFEERKHWGEYRKAYEEALSRCSRSWAPWYVIPGDHKWFRNFAVSQILVDTLEAFGMKFPKPAHDLSKIRLR